MTRVYVNLVREGLTQLASEQLQRQLWLPSDNPHIGSFEEAVEHTYTDSGQAAELDKSRAIDELGATAVGLLQELDDLLSSVDRARQVEDLISSPEMSKVRSLAEAALEALPVVSAQDS